MSSFPVQLPCLQLLLGEGYRVDVPDNAGVTAQRVAEIYGHSDCVKAIADHVMRKNGK